jgi:DNA/RNA endonuclease G (NUC1)
MTNQPIGITSRIKQFSAAVLDKINSPTRDSKNEEGKFINSQSHSESDPKDAIDDKLVNILEEETHTSLPKEKTLSALHADETLTTLMQNEVLPDLLGKEKVTTFLDEETLEDIFEQKVLSNILKEENETEVPREGYKDDFLGEDAIIPLPEVGEEDKDKLLKFGDKDDDDYNTMRDYARDYTHFSVVMNEDRKYAHYTAHNIDGSTLQTGFSRPSWRLDHEVGPKNQLGDSFYKHSVFDKGHLVRRMDVCWGTADQAKQAHRDSFYYTNAAPQHYTLNRKTWHSVENWVLKNADVNDEKVSVFAGPVLKDDDITFRGTQIPTAFWKVVAVQNEGEDKPSATAFVVSQEELIKGNLKATEKPFEIFKTGNDAFVDAPVQTIYDYHVPLEELQEITNLDFGDINDVHPDELFAKDQEVQDEHDEDKSIFKTVSDFILHPDNALKDAS